MRIQVRDEHVDLCARHAAGDSDHGLEQPVMERRADGPPHRVQRVGAACAGAGVCLCVCVCVCVRACVRACGACVRVHASCVLLRARRCMQERAQADVARRSNTLQAASARVLSVTSGLPCDSLSDTPSAPLRCSPHTQWQATPLRPHPSHCTRRGLRHLPLAKGQKRADGANASEHCGAGRVRRRIR